MSQFKKRVLSSRLLCSIFIAIVITVFALVARISYAFFAPEFFDAKGKVAVDTATVDDLNFSVGDPIVINATSTTLTENGSNISKTTNAKVSLTARSDATAAVSYDYHVYLRLTNNTFVYSDGTTPEILISVTGPSGEVTAINNLNYGTYNGVSGFDITTKNGLFELGGENISTTTSTEEMFDISVTYLNWPNIDQSINYNHNATVEIIVSQTEISS